MESVKMIGKLKADTGAYPLSSRPKPVHLLRRANLLSKEVMVTCGGLGKITIRSPRESDYGEVFQFQEAMYRNGIVFWGNTTRFHAISWVDWAVKATRGAKAVISIADRSGRIAGIATIATEYTQDGGGVLILGVAPWAENNHVGTILTGNALEKAAFVGFPRVTLYVNRHNIFAQRIYRKHGFRECRGRAKVIKMTREL